MSSKSNIIKLKSKNIYTVEYIDWKSFSVDIKAESEEEAELIVLANKFNWNNKEPKKRLFGVSSINKKE